MARIRSIKPEFWTSEQIVECSPSARLLFIGLWNFCDDGGVHPDSTKRIKMEIFPGDQLSDSDIKKLIDELVAANLIIRFQDNEKSFLAVTGWHHQKIERPSYRWPQPPNGRLPIAERSSNSSRTIAERSPPEGSGGDRKKENIKRKSRAFQKPTIAEVQAYCLERKNGIDAEHFVAYYEARGWKTKSGPIASWKHAIITWEKNRPAKSGPRLPTAEEDAGWTP